MQLKRVSHVDVTNTKSDQYSIQAHSLVQENVHVMVKYAHTWDLQYLL